MLAINGRGREGWHTICQDSSIAALQQHAQLPPQVPPGLLLLLPWLADQRCPQPLHLPHRCLVPAPKGFDTQVIIVWEYLWSDLIWKRALSPRIYFQGEEKLGFGVGATSPITALEQKLFPSSWLHYRCSISSSFLADTIDINREILALRIRQMQCNAWTPRGTIPSTRTISLLPMPCCYSIHTILVVLQIHVQCCCCSVCNMKCVVLGCER